MRERLGLDAYVNPAAYLPMMLTKVGSVPVEANRGAATNVG